MSTALENFGKYVLLERLAAGGMAEVYLAKSLGASGISKFIAVKRILPQYSENPEFVEMFKEEAKIAVNLNHGNVVSIFDFGIEKHQFFLVMEYVEGQNLRQVLNHLKKDNKHFSIDQIVYIVKEVAAGLDHAHRCLDGTTGKPLNITHRDMSPQNIMVSFEGEVKIVDFGIAKAESQMEHTRAGTIKGKFGYMSPEQADGQPVDLRTDIFSLGIVLWELLANDRLFTSNSEAGTLRKIRECQIPSLRKLNPAIPPELERICNKALAKDKSLRYQTSSAFNRDLNRFINTQYPEFSPHDFSVFMKSAFSQMFIENRKKLIEFAKVQGGNQSSDPSHNTVVTSTGTMTLTDEKRSLNADESEVPDESLKINTNSAKVDLSDLNIKAPLKKPGVQGTNPNIFMPPAGTQTGIRRGPMPSPVRPKESSNTFLYVLALVLLGLGGFVWKKQSAPHEDYVEPIAAAPAEVAPPKMEQTDTASKQPYAVIIESSPPGARVFIDGQDTGMLTPTRRTIDADKEFTVSLRLEGYTYYERRERASSNGYQVRASLIPLPKMGYINVDLANAGSNPVVLINGNRIEDKMPLRNYAIVANSAVKIQVHNPFTGMSAEQTVTVGPNQRQNIKLILSKRQSNNNR